MFYFWNIYTVYGSVLVHFSFALPKENQIFLKEGKICKMSNFWRENVEKTLQYSINTVDIRKFLRICTVYKNWYRFFPSYQDFFCAILLYVNRNTEIRK